MKYDDRPDEAKRLTEARLARGFETPKDAARFYGWKYETYIQHEQGTRGITRAYKTYAKAFHVDEAWLLTGDGKGPSGHKERARNPVPPELIELIEQVPGSPLTDREVRYLKDALNLIVKSRTGQSSDTQDNETPPKD